MMQHKRNTQKVHIHSIFVLFNGKRKLLLRDEEYHAMHRILVVEDNTEISEPLIKLLKYNNFHTNLCDQGDLAISALQKFTPHLVLLDLSLPVMGGLDICKLVRYNNNVPIIIISANVSPKIRLQCFELGVDDFVNKPFSMSELLLRINAVLKRC